jgi:hypothetical protein
MNPAMTKESPKYSGGVEKRDGIGGAFEGGLYSHRSLQDEKLQKKVVTILNYAGLKDTNIKAM